MGWATPKHGGQKVHRPGPLGLDIWPGACLTCCSSPRHQTLGGRDLLPPSVSHQSKSPGPLRRAQPPAPQNVGHVSRVFLGPRRAQSEALHPQGSEMPLPSLFPREETEAQMAA